MLSTSYTVRRMTAAGHGGIMALLRNTVGVGLRDADSPEGIARYLERNPGMSFVAEVQGTLAGCVFGGHDGRRGYLYHLAVAPDCRIGSSLVAAAIAAIAAHGIEKFRIGLLAGNEDGQRFWQAIGRQAQDDLRWMPCIPSGRGNC